MDIEQPDDAHKQQRNGNAAPLSYKEKLMPPNPTDIQVTITIGLDQYDNYYEEDNITPYEAFLPIDLEEKRRLYKPWEKSLILKVFGRRVGYLFLLMKLQQLWKLNKEVKLMDLGNDIYLVRFQYDINYSKVLHEGLWFIGQNFLTIRHWKPVRRKRNAKKQLYGYAYQASHLNFMI